MGNNPTRRKGSLGFDSLFERPQRPRRATLPKPRATLTDPWQLARKAATEGNIFDEVAIYADMVQVHQEPGVCGALLSYWHRTEARRTFRAGVRSKVAAVVVPSLLRFRSMEARVIEIASTVRHPRPAAMIWLAIAEQQPVHLATAREAVRASVETEQRFELGERLALLTQDPEDYGFLEDAYERWVRTLLPPDRRWPVIRHVGRLARLGESNRARTGAARIDDPYCQIIAHALILLATRDPRDRATLTGELSSLNGFERRETNTIVRALIADEELETARTLIRDVSRPRERAFLFSLIAALCGDEQDIHEEQRVFESGIEVPVDDEMRRMSALANARCGRREQAMQIATRTTAPRERARAYLGVFCTLNRLPFPDFLITGERAIV